MGTVILAASDLPAAPVLVVMGLGVLIAMWGHAAKSRKAVVTGLVVLFISTILMIVGGLIAYQDDDADPRPRKPPGEADF